MAAKQIYRHWRLESDADQLIWCHLDVAGESANVLSRDVLGELASVVDQLEKESPRGAVFVSDKRNGFIAGADVRQFTKIGSPGEAEQFVGEVHVLFDRLERLSCPTLCLIHGFCLGGGLELALSCRYRVARDDPETRLGFPEVRLGIIPGFGGTMRSVRLLGAVPALQLMLSGRTLDARRAERLGLVDRVVPERQMQSAARHLLLRQVRRRRAPIVQRLLQPAPVRRLLAGVLRRQLRRRVRAEHYPAPYALVDHWEANGGDPREMLAGEARVVAELLSSETSRNLVRAFLLQERLKAFGRGAENGIDRVHVVGAGVMGGDIAAWCAVQGLHVTLQDREPRFIAPAIRRAHALFTKRLKHPRLVREAMDRLVPDLRGSGVAGADIVIEAIVEDRGAKCALFQSIEPRLKDSAILASNTSSIALESLGSDLHRPDRLVGVHFFNPVSKMQLVEIVRGAATSDHWVERAAAFCRRIGRLPLPVRSGPGFLVNRILTPYLMETTLLLEEGVAAERIDAAATRFGMPMGPVELADTVGLDICLSVARNLAEKLGMAVPAPLQEMVEAGHLGKKAGRGFYRYRNGRPVRRREGTPVDAPPEIEERLVLRILNECAACLSEGIVADADLLDAGMIFGTGFAPFRGGPIHYARGRGIETVVADLEDMAGRLGERFMPNPHWQNLKNAG
ncbi:MAG: enoyl-CoA hydratase/isomerase family protein [Gammaproteobacteria bacterium]|nr:enoyl-CoA hydratase/isomerase family protein [Gammaproteobacteria bacterium]